MQGEKGLEFSFDKGLLEHLDSKRAVGGKTPKKGKDFGRASQFHSRGRKQARAASTEEAYPSAFQVRKKINDKAMAPESAHGYCRQLYGLHTVHNNLVNFLATEREAMAQKPTFQPAITFKGRQMFEGTGKSVADRSDAWIERRAAKLQAARQDQAAKEESNLLAATAPLRPISRTPNHVRAKVTAYWEPLQPRFGGSERPPAVQRTIEPAYMATTGDLTNFLNKNTQ